MSCDQPELKLSLPPNQASNRHRRAKFNSADYANHSNVQLDKRDMKLMKHEHRWPSKDTRDLRDSQRLMYNGFDIPLGKKQVRPPTQWIIPSLSLYLSGIVVV